MGQRSESKWFFIPIKCTFWLIPYMYKKQCEEAENGQTKIKNIIDIEYL